MLVAPLLTLLAHAFAHNHYAIVAQTANDGFGDATTRGKLTYAWLMRNGIDDVGGGGGPE